jgi:hypothetical protein
MLCLSDRYQQAGATANTSGKAGSWRVWPPLRNCAVFDVWPNSRAVPAVILREVDLTGPVS